MSTNTNSPRAGAITLRIATVRNQRVITDADLALLYGVPTKRFNEAVKRNAARFPPDFMFTLNAEEFSALRSQIATSNADWSIGRARSGTPAGRDGEKSRCAGSQT